MSAIRWGPSPAAISEASFEATISGAGAAHTARFDKRLALMESFVLELRAPNDRPVPQRNQVARLAFCSCSSAKTAHTGSRNGYTPPGRLCRSGQGREVTLTN